MILELANSNIIAYSFAVIYSIICAFHHRATSSPVFNTIAAIIKWLSVFLLIPEFQLTLTSSQNLTIETSQVGWIILLYSLGDIFIFIDQAFSLLFFGSGHIYLLTSFFQFDPFSTRLDYLVAVLLVSMLLAYLLSPHHLGKWFQYYIYVIIMFYYLVIPLLHNYYGTFLLTVSDCMIGFKIPGGHLLEWPLYYIALLIMINSF